LDHAGYWHDKLEEAAIWTDHMQRWGDCKNHNDGPDGPHECAPACLAPATALVLDARTL